MNFLFYQRFKYFYTISFTLCICWTIQAKENIPNTVVVDIPQLLINSAGNMVAIWEETNQNLDLHVIKAAYTLLPENAWSVPFTLSDPLCTSVSPKFSMNESGFVAAIWMTKDSILGRNILYASTITLGTGSWTTPVALSLNTESILGDYFVRVNSTGYTVAIWNSLIIGTNDYPVFSSTCPPEGTWSAPQQISP